VSVWVRVSVGVRVRVGVRDRDRVFGHSIHASM
jgi:hypothetical protein